MRAQPVVAFPAVAPSSGSKSIAQRIHTGRKETAVSRRVASSSSLSTSLHFVAYTQRMHTKGKESSPSFPAPLSLSLTLYDAECGNADDRRRESCLLYPALRPLTDEPTSSKFVTRFRHVVALVRRLCVGKKGIKRGTRITPLSSLAFAFCLLARATILLPH